MVGELGSVVGEAGSTMGVFGSFVGELGSVVGSMESDVSILLGELQARIRDEMKNIRASIRCEHYFRLSCKSVSLCVHSMQ